MPEPVVTKDARKAHLATMEALLIAEGQTLRDVRRAVAPMRERRIVTTDDAIAVARAASGAVEDTLSQTAVRTRSISLTTMRGEFAVARNEAIKAGVVPMALPPGLPKAKTNRDAENAQKEAQQIHVDMVKRAKSILGDADRASRATGADLLPDYALDSLAASHTAQTFHGERRRVEREVKERYAGTRWLPAMLKQWDATLDVRTCKLCRALDGKWRPWGFDFPGGANVPRHARCRCMTVYVFSPLFLGRREAETA